MSTAPTADEAVAATRCWVEQVVIGLNLCPFAAGPARGGRIRYRVSTATDSAALLQDLRAELLLLAEADPATVATTLLIVPDMLGDFLDYNDFLDLGDVLLEELELDGTLQLASFHPDYRFADSAPDDPADYTNRSPHPLLHLLREDDIARAVDTHPDIDAVPEQNVNRLRERGLDAARQLLAGCVAPEQAP